MKNYITVFSIICLLISCKSVDSKKIVSISKIDVFLQDSISIRAIATTKDTVWFAANRNKVGYIDLKTNKSYVTLASKKYVKTEFRSIAVTDNAVFALSVGNPAQLYKFSKDLKEKQLVYTEEHEKVFYDSMQFFDNLNGIAIGDPIEDCFAILTTNNGGISWEKVSCKNLPKLYEGEAAFAASNSNIVIKNNKVWIVSGGKKARVFYSNNKGKNWQVFDTPIIQGEAMTGIFTADFYDENIGIVAGGNYENPNQNTQNKALTTNGGTTWNLVANGSGFGYASCVQFFPNSKGKKIVSVGTNGLYGSNDMGNTWKKLLDDSSLYTIRFIDSYKAIAAGKNKLVLLEFQY